MQAHRNRSSSDGKHKDKKYRNGQARTPGHTRGGSCVYVGDQASRGLPLSTNPTATSNLRPHMYHYQIKLKTPHVPLPHQT
jgi:hypothetical protein